MVWFREVCVLFCFSLSTDGSRCNQTNVLMLDLFGFSFFFFFCNHQRQENCCVPNKPSIAKQSSSLRRFRTSKLHRWSSDTHYSLSWCRFATNRPIGRIWNQTYGLNPYEICLKWPNAGFVLSFRDFLAVKKTPLIVNLRGPHSLIFWSFFFFPLSWLQQSHKGNQSPEDQISSHLFAAFFQLPAKLLAFSHPPRYPILLRLLCSDWSPVSQYSSSSPSLVEENTKVPKNKNAFVKCLLLKILFHMFDN